MKAGTSKSQHKYIKRKKVKGTWIYDYGKGYGKGKSTASDKPKAKVILKKPKDSAKPKAKSKDSAKPKAKSKPSTKKAPVKKTKIVLKKPEVILKKPEPKIKIDDYYGKGQPRYFKTKEELKEFKASKKLGFTGGKLKKITSTSRIKLNTKVIVKIDKKEFTGKVIKTHRINVTNVQSPTHFDIEYYNSKTKKTMIKKKVPAENVTRQSKSFKEKKYEQKTTKDKKRDVFKEEGNALISRNMELSPEIQAEAKALVDKNWETFQNIAGKYWRSRVNSGWDAAKFGFEYDDMKQEVYLTIYRAALSYVTNPKVDGRATFRSYVIGFLKANMAATLAVKSGGGGHMNASGKDQMYLWFFKTSKDDFRNKHGGRMPTDVEMMELLNKKRKELDDIKGNQTIRKYDWTIDKVRNKNMLSKRMESLDRVINMGDGRSDTLLSVLNDEEVEVAGHYKPRPWEEVQKIIVREEVKKAINRKLPNPVDRMILIRTYGLFVNEDSPLKERLYAQGSTPKEISELLNKIEAKRKSKKRWTTGTLNVRLVEILKGLREDPDFERRMKAFVKSVLDGDDEWSDVELIFYWITMHNVMSDSIDELLNYGNFESMNEEQGIKFLVDKKYGGDTEEGDVSEETKMMGFIKNKYVE